MATHDPAHVVGRAQAILSIRLRTVILIVAAVGICLGCLQYCVRSAAVNRLLAVVPSGILLDVGPSSPWPDPTYEPDRLRYMPHIRRVAKHHGEALAETRLAEMLRAARSRSDEKSMRGALAALLWIGCESPFAMEQIIHTARGSELRLANSQSAAQIRCLAVHLLGRVARDNDKALSALIETLERSDPSSEEFVATSAANELGALGSRAKVAVRTLVDDLESRRDTAGGRLLFFSVIGALEHLGSNAGQAAPRLIAIAQDPGEDNHIRVRAIRALSQFLPEKIGIGGGLTESHRMIIVALIRLVPSSDVDIRMRAVQALDGAQSRFWLSPSTETDFLWLLRMEAQILGPGHPVVKATAGRLRRIYLLRAKSAEVAKLDQEVEALRIFLWSS